MIHCLSLDLYNDIQYLKRVENKHIQHLGFGSSVMYLDMFNSLPGVYFYLDLIVEAAKKIEINDYMITRLVYNLSNLNSTTSLGHVSLKEDYSTDGTYSYVYVYCYKNSEKLYVSKVQSKPTFLVEDGKRIFKFITDDSEYTFDELAKSTDKVKLSALIPPDAEMFSPSKVDYLIPTRLLK